MKMRQVNLAFEILEVAKKRLECVWEVIKEIFNGRQDEFKKTPKKKL